jgi:AbiTii
MQNPGLSLSKEFAQWIAWELDGYPDSQPTPDYRRLSITYYASFFGMGWEVQKQAIPLQVVPPEHHDRFTLVEFREGIVKADSLARSTHSVTVSRPELTFTIQGKMYPQLQCQHVWGEISPIEFQQILSAVRNRILDFSLSVEAENPDAGEAPPNSQPIPQEKLKPLVQNFFHGNVGAVSQNSEQVTQIVNLQVSFQEIGRLVTDLTAHIDELGLDQHKKQQAEAQLGVLKAEATAEGNPTIIRQAGRTLRNITEGAIGSLLATAATQPAVWHSILQVLAKF